MFYARLSRVLSEFRPRTPWSRGTCFSTPIGFEMVNENCRGYLLLSQSIDLILYFHVGMVKFTRQRIHLPAD
jgi:hypothetical protein